MASSCSVVPKPPNIPKVRYCDRNSTKLSVQDNPLKCIDRLICCYPHLSTKHWLVHFRSTTSLLQDGPQCGLVSLCMACQLLGVQLTTQELFKMSREKSYSLQGEMFSANYMAQLAEDVGLKSSVVSMETDQELIIINLMNGRPVLVPYDSDSNFSPCLKRGHKAHWATLTGVLFSTNYQHLDSKYSTNKDSYYIQDAMNVNFSLEDFKHISVNDVYVFAKQGKSRHLALWSMDDLRSSNDNLYELDPVRAKDIGSYILPPGGVEHGLRGKVVLLSRG